MHTRLKTAFLLAFLAGTGWGWELKPLETLIAESDLVVVGRLADVRREEPGPSATDRGTIRPQELLKGRVPDGGGAVLSFPGRRGSYGVDGLFHSTLTGADLRFEEGLEACWFLKRNPADGTYAVSHPSMVQPHPFYDSIRGAIAGRAKSAPAAR